MRALAVAGQQTVYDRKATGVEIAARLGFTRSAVSKLASRGRIDLLVHKMRHALLHMERGDD